MKGAKIFSFVFFFMSSVAAFGADSEGTPAVEEYAPRPMRAVTFIVDSKGNPTLTSISLNTIRKIYNCTLRNWKDVPGSNRTDEIFPVALGKKSEATRLLEKRIPKFELGPCVTTIIGPDPSMGVFYGIGPVRPNKFGATENYPAIGYLNYGPLRTGQKPLAISDDLNKKKPGPAVAPSERSLKSRYYVLAP